MQDSSARSAPRIAKSPAPLPAEEILRRDNVINNKPLPAELLTLKSSNSITAIGSAGDLSAEKLIQRVEADVRGASFNLRGENIVSGLPGRESGRLSLEEVQRTPGAGQTLAGYRPGWADTIYHPKQSRGIIKPTMRSLKGNRVEPLYVFGSDARQPFYPSGYPWHCIGRVFAWTNPASPNWTWSGSGALVTHNTIITAGHVAPWGSSPWKVLFVPAYFNGSSTLGSSVYSYVESYWGYNTNDTVSAYDYCVMKLYDPLGNSLGWLGSKTYDGGWNDGNYWTLVGYPGSIAGAQQPSSQGAISFHDDDEDGSAMELETDNGDASPGDSGGPFFAWWADGWPYVVGVCSGQESEYQFPFSSEQNNIAAGGSAMVDLIRWALNNWP